MARTEKQEPETPQPILPWEARFDKSPRSRPVQVVLDKGCKPIPLREFLRLAANTDWYMHRQKLDVVDPMKSELVRIVNVAKEAAADLDHLADNPTWSSARHFTELAYLHRGAADFRTYAVGLEQIQAEMAKNFSVRKINYQMPLCLYCMVAAETVTKREIAELILWAQAPGGRRFRSEVVLLERSLAELVRQHREDAHYVELQDLMSDYVAACPDGDVSFGAWRRQQTNRILTGEHHA